MNRGKGNAVRVVERGNPPIQFDWEGIWECGSCNSKVAFDFHDAGVVEEVGHKKVYFFFRIPFLTAQCPVCEQVRDFGNFMPRPRPRPFHPKG